MLVLSNVYANCTGMLTKSKDLVYTSFGSAGTGPIHAPHLCVYHGETHLCYYQGVQHVGWGHGHGVVMNQNYRVVKSIEPSCTYQASSDMHEFQLIDNGRLAMMTQYVRSVYNLCPWGLCDGLGYIQSSGFQIINVENGKCEFGWTSLDHVQPKDSLIPPSSTEISGSGESPEMPWDYFHINSIDKSDFDGSYLISARHMSAIYKIDGKSGDIVWQFGGLKNDYEFDNEFGDINFGFQHDARWISDSKEESVIAFFDNASNGYTETSRHSTGKIIRLNHVTKTAKLVERPLDPPFVDGHAHLSKSQGNYQLNLPASSLGSAGSNQGRVSLGNRLMGFGNDAFFAEYAWNANNETGGGEWETVFYGAMAWAFMMNYRVLKFDGWEGVPLTKPAVWAFSQHGMNHTIDNTNTMTVYTSWNGHTKVNTFMFHGANTRDAKKDLGSRDWEVLIGGFKKNGFETIYTHPRTYRYVYVEAFDVNSVRLGRSDVVETFIPSELMRDRYCDELACAWMDTNNPDRDNMRENMKNIYNTWKESKQNGSEEDMDELFDRLSKGVRGSSKKMVYWIIFGVLALAMLGVGVTITRRYIGIRGMIDNAMIASGLNVRRNDQSRKGQYQGLANDDVDIEDNDLNEAIDMAGFGESPTRTDHIASQVRKTRGPEVERQPLWKGE